MTTGQLASRTGVGRETIRFYESRGLLGDPPRNASGYRMYPPQAVAHILFIKRAKRLGFTLDEISELLNLHGDSGSACSEVKRRGEEKIKDIELKIRDLTRMKDALGALVAACANRTTTADCPLLGSLDGEVA